MLGVDASPPADPRRGSAIASTSNCAARRRARPRPRWVMRGALLCALSLAAGTASVGAAAASPEPPVEGPAPPPTTSQTQRASGQSQRGAAAEGPAESREAPAAEGPATSSAPASPAPPPRLAFDGPMPEIGEGERGKANLGLRRQSDGSYLYVDPYRRFTALFNPDGTVHFADRWRRPDNRNTQRGKFGGPPVGLFTPNGMSVTGPAEWVMALQGIDRDARAKAELLARTREVRIAMAIQWGRELLATRYAALGGELEAIWGESAAPIAARRELLFERWDECDESFAVDAGEIPEEALSELDRTRIEIAEKARRTIEAFIRESLPKGTAKAYSDRELRELNARRRSRQRFTPYRSK